ncbi:MAG: type II secretion system protein GspE, partial [Lysobacterales bacterium 13-68-4]
MSAVVSASGDATQAAMHDREAAVCALLVSRGALKDGDLARARRLHEEAPEGTLTALMARLGLVSERDLAQAWSELLDAPLVAARDLPELPPSELDVSPRFLKQQHVVPIRRGEDGLALVVSDPADPYPLDAVRLAAGKPVALCIG